MRKDAARNRDDVLAAAERVFAREGLGASVETIARESGVGVGTVYRRFGSKAGLVDALFTDRVSEMADAIRECAAVGSGRDALHRVLRVYVDFQSHNRAVRELLLIDIEHGAEHLRAEIEPLLSAIIDRAKAEQAVRADFTATDIPLLTHAIADIATRMPGIGAELARRHLELLIKGLAPTPDDVPVPAPLPDARFGEWLRAMGGAR
nr:MULTISPECIES: TetR/AcrR family transcriptional regulator [Microbacterium]